MFLRLGLVLFLSLSTNVVFGFTTYGEDNVKVVGKDKDEKVEAVASSVCSINFGCCSGFSIAKNLVMTNHHCLACINNKANLMQSFEASATAFMGFSTFLKSNPLGIDMSSKIKDIKKSLFDDVDYSQLDPRLKDFHFDSEQKLSLAAQMVNALPKDFTTVSFNFEKGETVKTQNIVKVVSENSLLDVVIIEIEDTSETVHPLKLAADIPEKGQRLINVGHPGKSPSPGMKTYDSSKECKVVHPLILVNGNRPRIGHQCDTNPGSSGSPLIDYDSYAVLALHNAGGALEKECLKEGVTGCLVRGGKSWRESFNQGVPMASILSLIKYDYPEIYQQLDVVSSKKNRLASF